VRQFIAAFRARVQAKPGSVRFVEFPGGKPPLRGSRSAPESGDKSPHSRRFAPLNWNFFQFS
jgi:hypothetical protein